MLLWAMTVELYFKIYLVIALFVVVHNDLFPKAVSRFIEFGRTPLISFPERTGFSEQSELLRQLALQTRTGKKISVTTWSLLHRSPSDID
jgi:hypothetical protein